MDFYEVIEKRRSIREFESVEMDDDIIERIIGAGLKAPANGNMRSWHFIVIKDKQSILQLIDIIPKEISDEDMEQLLKDWNINDPFQQASYRYSVPRQYRMLADASGADLDALVKALNRYNLDIPELYYICTLELAREYVPKFSVQNYSMSALCQYFRIDMDSEHDAFDDACANSDLFKVLVGTYDIDIDSCVKKYIPHESRAFTSYVASPVIRKAISEFYGMIRGFSIDNEINAAEAASIIKWKEDNQQYRNFKEFSSIISVIDSIAADGVITIDEIIKLQSTVKSFLDLVSTAPVTLATQILDGIMKGITVDGEISETECKSLCQWLYDNIYLSGHFPFDKLLRTVEDVLADSRVTKEESAYLTSIINELLNPVDTLKAQINSVDGKHICLSGNFRYGQKSDVEKYIIEHGGLIDSSVKKTTDILLIGDCECQAYSNGTYGTKVKKALEYNEKGSNIQIMKEADLFSRV